MKLTTFIVLELIGFNLHPDLTAYDTWQELKENTALYHGDPFVTMDMATKN